MIPVINYDLQSLSIKNEVSKTFRISNNRIIGTIDELEAIKQSIYLILNIERYDSLIYSWNYGIELNDLIGMEIDFIYPVLKRRIEEALLQDDRIQSVDEFTFSKKRGIVEAKFTVHTSYGDVNVEKEVSV